MCPLCNTAAYAVIYDHPPLYPQASIVQCRQCGHIYSVCDDVQSLEKLYNEGVYEVVENRRSVFDKILDFEYKKLLKKISRYKTQGRLLDFGCGKGKWAGLARAEGWQVKAVETSAGRAAYASTIYGLDVNTGLYAGGQVFPGWRFDVITCFHVMEHLPRPKTTLHELIRHNLDEGGLLVLEVPNFRSLQARIAGNRWMHLDASHHVSHFTPIVLDNLLGGLNLRTIKRSTFSVHLGVLGMVDTILKILGHRKNLIYQLKHKRNAPLVMAIAAILPLAFLLEFLSSMAGAGAVTRRYLVLQALRD